MINRNGRYSNKQLSNYVLQPRNIIDKTFWLTIMTLFHLCVCFTVSTLKCHWLGILLLTSHFVVQFNFSEEIQYTCGCFHIFLKGFLIAFYGGNIRKLRPFSDHMFCNINIPLLLSDKTL